MFSMLKQHATRGYVHTLTDAGGRVVGTRTSPRALAGAVVVLSEWGGPSVWSWHSNADSAARAAQTLRLKRPEFVVEAVTA